MYAWLLRMKVCRVGWGTAQEKETQQYAGMAPQDEGLQGGLRDIPLSLSEGWWRDGGRRCGPKREFFSRVLSEVYQTLELGLHDSQKVIFPQFPLESSRLHFGFWKEELSRGGETQEDEPLS